jgi:hypothetical protein
MSTHLRLIADNGELLPRRRVSIDAPMLAMRLCAAIIEREPAVPGGYTPDEFAAQFAAVDRMIAAFHVLDAKLGHPGAAGVSRHGHPTTQSPREKEKVKWQEP